MTAQPSVHKTLNNSRARLLAEREPDGWWRGELSSSALSTATACAALAMVGKPEDEGRVRAGQAWLAEHQNADGGYGDTIQSPSNLSTTALAWMALGQSKVDGPQDVREAHARAANWLKERIGDLTPEHLAAALRDVYADDHTFAVPIQVACTASGCFDANTLPWASIPRLPYELAALPGGLFKWLGLPVVSYALPALIAIGQAIETKRPSRNPFLRVLRSLTRVRTLRKLAQIQPKGGGYLEATPLTSFVVLSLVACGHSDYVVVREGASFLRNSMRADGSWPIDTDLATWLTTLSINALAANGDLDAHLDAAQRKGLGTWLAQQQHLEVHPYTGAAPGGWAWTPLPGGVPDADDTPGAMLAMNELEAGTKSGSRAAALWLCDLQNKDGGMPTFCKGWGKLPFDASCPDLTAHALRAWDRVDTDDLGSTDITRIQNASACARAYLVGAQSEAGSWSPLWFGNQHTPEQANPVYGTSRVLRALCIGSSGGSEASPAGSQSGRDRNQPTTGSREWNAALDRGLRWLLSVQNEDGGFGGDRGANSTVEETGLALEALGVAARAVADPTSELLDAITRGARYLARATHEGTQFDPQPIGLYFAKLWYSERLYPVIFTVSALELCSPFLPKQSVTA